MVNRKERNYEEKNDGSVIGGNYGGIDGRMFGSGKRKIRQRQIHLQNLKAIRKIWRIIQIQILAIR